MQILIIGNSAAGIGASEAIRQHDKECAITMMSEETGPIYSRCLLSYYLSGHIDQTRLAFRPDSFYQENNVRLIAGKRAAAVDVSRQCVICDDDSKINYDKLLIATGASAKIPEFIQVPVQGIHVLRTLADAVAIQQRINSVRHVVVLGGGLVGMKAAFALQKRGLDVTVVVRSKHALSQMIDYQGAQMVMSRLHENNIKIFIEADITDIKVRDKNIESVMMKDFSIDSNQEIPCELLIAAKAFMRIWNCSKRQMLNSKKALSPTATCKPAWKIFMLPAMWPKQWIWQPASVRSTRYGPVRCSREKSPGSI
jgi:nitrite reductase (NADH) large subunit